MLGLDLAQFFLGAQVDGAEPFALATQPLQIGFHLGHLGQRLVRCRWPRGWRPRPARLRASPGSRGRHRRAGACRPRSAPRRARPPRARCPWPPARPARHGRLRQARSRLGQTSAAARRAVSAVSISPISARRFSSNTRGASSRPARSLLASSTRASRVLICEAALSLRPLQACRSAAIAASRRAAISASRASACASARTSASCVRWPSMSPLTLASRVSISAPAAVRRAPARRRRAQRPLRRGSRSAAPSLRRAPRAAPCCGHLTLGLGI